MNQATTGNNIVDEIGKINITGNVIPQSWYKAITRENGKPNLPAIVILADIVYWYRPTEVRDEQTGQVMQLKKRFKADFLQRSYQQIADQFGLTKREASNAVTELEKLGVIKKHFRTLDVSGMKVANVLFIELVPSVLIEITFGVSVEVTPITLKSDTLSLSKVTPSTSKSETNTKITTEITTENKRDIKAHEPIPLFNPDSTNDQKEPRKKKQSIPPSLEEVEAYIKEKGYGLDAEEFMDGNAQRGWILNNGKKMADWKAAVRTWERNRIKWSKGSIQKPKNDEHVMVDNSSASDWGIEL
jgi:DNA-binding Lrp family transcriptional regulator